MCAISHKSFYGGEYGDNYPNAPCLAQCRDPHCVCISSTSSAGAVHICLLNKVTLVACGTDVRNTNPKHFEFENYAARHDAHGFLTFPFARGAVAVLALGLVAGALERSGLVRGSLCCATFANLSWDELLVVLGIRGALDADEDLSCFSVEGLSLAHLALVPPGREGGVCGAGMSGWFVLEAERSLGVLVAVVDGRKADGELPTPHAANIG